MSIHTHRSTRGSNGVVTLADRIVCVQSPLSEMLVCIKPEPGWAAPSGRTATKVTSIGCLKMYSQTFRTQESRESSPNGRDDLGNPPLDLVTLSKADQSTNQGLRGRQRANDQKLSKVAHRDRPGDQQKYDRDLRHSRRTDVDSQISTIETSPIQYRAHTAILL